MATTPTTAALAADPGAVLAPLASAAECCAAAGAAGAEAEAHYLRAVTLHALGRVTVGRAREQPNEIVLTHGFEKRMVCYYFKKG